MLLSKTFFLGFSKQMCVGFFKEQFLHFISVIHGYFVHRVLTPGGWRRVIWWNLESFSTITPTLKLKACSWSSGQSTSCCRIVNKFLKQVHPGTLSLMFSCIRNWKIPVQPNVKHSASGYIWRQKTKVLRPNVHERFLSIFFCYEQP